MSKPLHGSPKNSAHGYVSGPKNFHDLTNKGKDMSRAEDTGPDDDANMASDVDPDNDDVDEMKAPVKKKIGRLQPAGRFGKAGNGEETVFPGSMSRKTVTSKIKAKFGKNTKVNWK